MKKIFFPILAGLTINMAAKAQTLTVADVYATPGSTASFGITINANENQYKGFQFSLKFPESGFSINNSTTVNEELWDGSLTTSKKLSSTGKATVLAYSMGDIIPTTGNILIGTVDFGVDATLVPGDYQVTVSSIKLSGKTKATPANQTFTIHVVENPTLDELSTTLPSSVNGTNVNVKRTIKAGNWSTICLPFSMTEDQVASAFGNDAQIATFSSWEETAGSVKLTFTDGLKAIEAHHPYLIKVTSDISEFTVEGVDLLTPEADELYSALSVDVGSGVLFVGNYTAGRVIPVNGLYLNNNQLYYSTGTSIIDAFRAYLMLPSSVNFNSASRIVLSIEGNETTGAELIMVNDINEPCYNLNGQKVEKPAKGLYIRDGKKIIIN